MQDRPSTPFDYHAVSFSEFLLALFQALDREGLRPCVLRNYQGFPDINIGNDVDLVIRPAELPRAMRALESLEGIRVVGYAERQYVANVFLDGVSSAAGIRMQHVDFNLSLSWKGLPFLTTDAVLHAATPRAAGNLTFLVPCPVHEAVLSLFTSLLVGGWLKEKYFPEVQRTFAGNRFEVIAALQPRFGLKTATRLVGSVISGDRGKILDCVGPLRSSLALRSLLQRPVSSLLAIVRHYANELVIRFSPKTLENVFILGPDSCFNAAIIEALMPMLRFSAAEVETRHCTPRMLLKRQSPGRSQNADSPAAARMGFPASMAGIVQWLVKDRLGQFLGRKNLTLRISENCFEDLLIDPEKYRYGGPMWFARLAGKFFSSPDLCMVLDPAPERLQSRNYEASSAKNRGRQEAYRAFANTRKRCVTVDAGQPADRVIEAAYSAIVDTLAARAVRVLKSRF